MAEGAGLNPVDSVCVGGGCGGGVRGVTGERMLLRQGCGERRGGAKEAVEKEGKQGSLASALSSAPFWPHCPCVCFPTNKTKLDWMSIIPSSPGSNKLFVSLSTVHPHFRHC